MSHSNQVNQSDFQLPGKESEQNLTKYNPPKRDKSSSDSLKKQVLRSDPNSNYVLKAKYVTQDLIPEESNEMSSKQILES